MKPDRWRRIDELFEAALERVFFTLVPRVVLVVADVAKLELELRLEEEVAAVAFDEKPLVVPRGDAAGGGRPGLSHK